MDFDEASKVVTASPPALSELRQKVVDHHGDHPQKALLADRAFAEAEAALERLASLGHRFTLAEQPPATDVDEYPEMLYRGEGTMTVNTEEEKRAAIADGWAVHPSLQPAPTRRGSTKE